MSTSLATFETLLWVATVLWAVAFVVFGLPVFQILRYTRGSGKRPARFFLQAVIGLGVLLFFECAILLFRINYRGQVSPNLDEALLYMLAIVPMVGALIYIVVGLYIRFGGNPIGEIP